MISIAVGTAHNPAAKSIATDPILSIIAMISIPPVTTEAAIATARTTTDSTIASTESVHVSEESVHKAPQSALPSGQFYQQTGPTPVKLDVQGV
jgi:hypothetical protein